MAKLELSLSANYVPSWGKWEGVRDIAQNVRDAVVMLGATQEFKYQEQKKTLILASRGASIDARSLLLGKSTKADNADAAGQYGEGMKLAYLALVRAGCRVRVRTADEVWEPKIERSEKFAGEDVLVVYTRRHSVRQEGVVTAIEGIGLDEWALFKKRLLFLVPPRDFIDTEYGRVIFDAEHHGKIYVHGIYVQDLPKLSYGYDLANIKVDRDRNMASSFDVSWATSHALSSAMIERPELQTTFYDNFIERRVDGSGMSIQYASVPVREIVRDEFRRRHGDDTIPVSNDAEAQELRRFALSATVIADRELRSTLETFQGNYFERRSRALRTPSVVHRRDQMEWERLDRIQRAEKYLLAAGYEVLVSIVDFPSDTTIGMYDKDTDAISIAHRATDTLEEVLGTIIHEVAHRETDAADLTPQHTMEIESIWRKVWAANVRG